MSSVSYEMLNNSKKNLVEALGDNQTRYFQQMKNWFRGKVTKEEFDSEARDLLPSSVVYLHNEFLLAILTKCQVFTTTPPPLPVVTSVSSHLTTSQQQSLPVARSPCFSSSHTPSSASINNINSGNSSSTVSSSNSNITAAPTTTEDLFSSIDNASYNISSSQYTSSANNSHNSASNNNGPNNSNIGLFTNTFTPNNNSSNITNSNIITKKSSGSSDLLSLNTNNVFSHTTSTSISNNDIFNSLMNSTPNNNNSVSSRHNNYNSNNNSVSNLGTNTNAITINNSSSNISIKVEVPLHSLDCNLLSGGNVSSNNLLTGANNNNSFLSTPEKKKNRPPKKKLKTTKQNTEPLFESIPLHSVAPAMVFRDLSVLRDSRAGHHTRAQCLLGLGELRGRLLLATWEHGLGAATEGVVKLLQQATRQVLQSVLSTVIRSRGGFRVREGRFVHAAGTCPPNPWLRSASGAADWTQDSVGLPVSSGSEGATVGDRPLLWPTSEAAQQNAAHLMSFAPHHPPPHPPITTVDLYTALKSWPHTLPCHSVYSLCMERLSARLSHPDHAALVQETLMRQEHQYRHQLRQYRVVPSV